MRINSRRLGTLSVASALVLLSGGTAMADRRAALNGNQLFKDSEDTFLYPSHALQYRNRLEVEVGGSGDTARALFLGGEESLVIGFSAQQGSLPGLFTGAMPADLLARETAPLWAPNLTGGTAAPFGSVSFAGQTTPFSMIDGFVAMPVGDMNFGLRGTLGLTGQSTTTMGSDAGASQMLVGLTAGLDGGEAGGTHWDSSLNFTMNMLSVANGGAGDQSGTNMRVAVSTRLFIPVDQWVDIGVLGNVAVFSGGTTTGMGAGKFANNALGFGLMGGAGPVYHLPDGSTVGVYGLLGVATSGVDPNDTNNDDETNDLVVMFPAVRAAAEVAVTKWFFARAGLQYSFQYGSTTFAKPTGAPGPDSAAARTGQLGWSAGVGIKTGRFVLDGSLQQAWLTQGPDFLGGDSPLFGVVSIAYVW
jgi:hypothetical protein